MAKKQGSLNYNPNTVLIAGEGQMRDAQAQASLAGGAAFSAGFQKAFMAGLEENRRQQAQHEAMMIDLGGIDNIQYLDGENKIAVTNFLRTQRDEYSKLAELYSKTKDVALLDKMNAIKVSFNNLNTDIATLYNDKVGYVDASDKGQLVLGGKSFDQKFYDNVLLSGSGFKSINENGRLVYDKDGKDVLYADVAGKWNVKNNIAESLVLQTDAAIVKNAQKGFGFDAIGVKNSFKSGFKQTGPEGLQVMAETDITGDDDFTLPNGQKVGNMSFEFMWGAGMLDGKYYSKRKSGDTSWMFDNANTDELNDLMSQYYTDVMQDRHKSNLKQQGGGSQFGTSFLSQPGKGKVFVDGGADNIDYNTGVKLLNDLSKAAQGQSVTVNVTGTLYKYNPSTNQWTDQDDNLVAGSIQKFITDTLGISDPAFLGIKASGNIQGATSGVNFNIFKEEEDEEQKKLENLFPDFGFSHINFGPRDRITVTDPNGNEIGTFDFDYSDDEDAKKEAIRFNNAMERYLQKTQLPIIKK